MSIISWAWRWFRSASFLALVGLILGSLVAIAAIPQPKIATIAVSGDIVDQSYTDAIVKGLTFAGDNRDIKAVALLIDSPGGSAGVVEQIYLDILRLRKRKPIVAYIGARGASGGYYIAVAANYIFAEPTSLLGSIGAWVTVSSPEKLDESLLASGPFKTSGGSLRKTMGTLATFRQQFLDAVVTQRGQRLKVPEETLARAEVYTGVEALSYGLIDEIGTNTNAVEKAADLAGIRNYGLIDLNEELGISPPLFLFFLSSAEDLKSLAGRMPGYYYLYFESR